MMREVVAQSDHFDCEQFLGDVYVHLLQDLDMEISTIFKKAWLFGKASLVLGRSNGVYMKDFSWDLS